MRILFLKRGVPSAQAQAIQTLGRDTGVVFEVQLTTATTHVIAAWSYDRVLKWLKLSALPPGVVFHSPDWLTSCLTQRETSV